MTLIKKKPASLLIMAVAFSGLFGSTELLLNEVAFLLVSAVVLDTFVVRTLLVPALFTAAGDRNWWPSPMPVVEGGGEAPPVSGRHPRSVEDTWGVQVTFDGVPRSPGVML